MRSASERTLVDRLHREGLSQGAIARQTGIPRKTVQNWVARPPVPQAGAPPPLPGYEYAYLLGVYLGDGYLARMRRTWRLIVTQDAQYQRVISEICLAIGKVAPASKVAVSPRQSGCVDISSYSNRWADLFPQHGPGRKHERAIVLADWQQQIADAQPRALIRGLIHSDGCFCVARQRGRRDTVYEYPRYFLSNRSEDIKAIFCEALDRVGVQWNRPNEVQIQISRREAVAKMDEFVGPKL